MKVVSKQHNSRMCYICGLDNPTGLRAQFYNMEDGSVITPFRFRDDHQSFPGRVHGGLAATMIDELGLRAMWVNSPEDVFGVTLSLSVKYRKPVPYNEPLLGRGIVVKETPMFVVIKSEIVTPDGAVLVNGEVKYIKLAADRIVSGGVDPHKEMSYLIEDDVKELPYEP